ncbi:hypothetical protein B9T38_05835 [Acinetobacter sp. ANC 4218]|uniref:hypothetical protein n=1 Tax=Acinetobacter sp. ANC 4218 TaxID=1977880 RepID=UPI000A34E4EA|nr:hypothetical protein [Acinetobacter sp. ANC 4218]OTG73132.1 hypothetical protein B9T38_05835 [Acinetobacter sp. ANC 4218]HAY5568464.1 hypothetical protein [Escherichia coli]
MFLHEIEHKASKVFLLEYACLLAMVEKSSESTATEIRENEENFIQPYSQCIDDYELGKLKEYAQTFDSILEKKSNFFTTNHNSFLKDSLENGSEKYSFDDQEVSSIYNGKYYGFESMEEYLSNGYFPALGHVLNHSIQSIFKKYGDDKDVKQRVIHELISSGIDLMDINPEKIHGVMISFEDIKSEILRDSVEILSSTKTAYLDEMTNKDKKSVLFELISFCFNSGKISNNQMDLIKQICICLRVDSAYIEEFMEVIQRLFAANKEAKELINE